MTSIVPANIALVAGSKAPEAGKRFIQFTLSDEGQALLLDKQISRLPVLPATYAKAPAGYPNPFSGKIQAKVNFDSNLSESRYYVVVALFDQLVTFRHKELAAATKAIQDAQKRVGTRTSRSSMKRGGSSSRRPSTTSRLPTRRSSPPSRRTRRTPTRRSAARRSKRNGRRKPRPITPRPSSSRTR